MAISKVSDLITWEIDVVNSDVPVFVDFGLNGVDHAGWLDQL